MERWCTHRRDYTLLGEADAFWNSAPLALFTVVDDRSILLHDPLTLDFFHYFFAARFFIWVSVLRLFPQVITPTAT